ncbi:hypothetical protein [Rhodovulum visakhapatnamense]|uniref:Uncharacterized protein n=1 Tax=Rhodovulum visakhapatnamense TaxID=364297 RepID=A0A4R8G956_9RHOB|nr:hypothetical protein [Rhodovulum visakhapatnamense]TDX33699.1 hypothetical protein EV657_101127 [Rhodovulum visakhapatnamense]
MERLCCIPVIANGAGYDCRAAAVRSTRKQGFGVGAAARMEV